jgi:hypothetical protein
MGGTAFAFLGLLSGFRFCPFPGTCFGHDFGRLSVSGPFSAETCPLTIRQAVDNPARGQHRPVVGLPLTVLTIADGQGTLSR